MGNIMVPFKNGHSTEWQSLETELFRARTVLLTGEIDETTANEIIMQLITLDRYEQSPIRLLISSPGGRCDCGRAIGDCMQEIESSVYTEGFGTVASMASIIFAMGDKGHRGMHKSAQIMIHQPLGGVQGQASDMELAVKNILATKEALYKTLSECTGQDYETIDKACDRDSTMNAQEALDFGLADYIKADWK